MPGLGIVRGRARPDGALKLGRRKCPSFNAPPNGRCLAALTIGQRKGRSKYVERPTGLKINYLKTQPAPVFTDCTNRAEGANQKCCSVKGTRTLWQRGYQYGVGKAVFLT